MSNDLLNETLVSLATAARKVPGRGGRPLHPSTIFRWICEGVRTPDGVRLKLEACRIGFSWKTSEQALRRFVDALTAAHSGDAEPPRPMPRSPSARRRASERAARELERVGIK